MYLFSIIFLVFIILLNAVDLYICNSYIIQNSFIQIYSKEKKLLQYQFEELMGCLNIDTFYNCLRKDKEIFKTKYSKTYYTNHPFNLSFYDNIKLNNEIIIQPKIVSAITNVFVVIPISPTQLQPRIAIRNTYSKILNYKNYIYKYIFVMGKPDSCDKNYNCYYLKYLEEENNMFSDILVFNYTNSYKLITLQLLLTYKYILETYRNVKFVARANSDMFIKSDLMGKLISKYKTYDIVGYKLYEKKLIYPCGAFYVFSRDTIKRIVDNYEYVKPMHDIEDIYYGQIMKQYNITNVKWINNEDAYICISRYNLHKIYVKKSFISIHDITSSGIIYLWKHFYEKKFHYFF